MAPLRVLLVSYNFPPVGGAGVQRMTKLVKYLARAGVSLRVLTVENPSVPVTDETLLADVPPSVEIIRARTLEPGYAVKRAAWNELAGQDAAHEPPLRRAATWLKCGAGRVAKAALVPDPQILWQPAASLALAGLLTRPDAPEVVCISGPPFSQFILAPLAKLRPGTRVVLDYRDEWSTYRASYEMMSPFAARIGEALERRLLRSADIVVTATEAFRRELLERFPFLAADAVRTIPNGYDPEDLPGELPDPPGDRFVLTYAGTVFRLTSARGLLGAVRRLHEREPELASLLKVRFIGRIVETEAAPFDGMERYGVERLGYVPHDRLMPELSASHLLACILDAVPGTERIYPAKIFELMALGRPCLTLAPEGALAELVRSHRLGDVVPPRDEAAIAAKLAEYLRRFREGRYVARAAPAGIERFDRRVQAEQFLGSFTAARIG